MASPFILTAQSSPEPSSPPAASPQVIVPLQPVPAAVPVLSSPAAAPVAKKPPVLHEKVTHKHAKVLLEQMSADEIRTQLNSVSFVFIIIIIVIFQIQKQINGTELRCDLVLIRQDLHERQVHHSLGGTAEPGPEAALGRSVNFIFSLFFLLFFSFLLFLLLHFFKKEN